MPATDPGAPTSNALAGGPAGPRALRPLTDTALDALTVGATARGGPLPAGGPDAVAKQLREEAGDLLPYRGEGAHTALRTLTTALAAGAADPAEPHCAAHLHTPPLAVAAAAELAVAALNPSLDSWDQAPAATALETLLAHTLAREIYPPAPGDTTTPDALFTTGGTESNQLALLLAREHHGPRLRILCGANAHHSIARAAWLLGLPQPTTLPTPQGILDPARLAAALHRALAPTLVVATAGTTDTGAIDPLPALAALTTTHGARLHIDAAHAGLLRLAPRLRHLVDGLQHAHTVTLDLHKLGWQPAAAGLLALRDHTDAAPLTWQADYLNAPDDTDAGLPDLLGRSLRTTRRPDAFKIAVTLKALGRTGLAELIEAVLGAAHHLATLIDDEPALELHATPTLTTVLFRPTDATDDDVAALRRDLLTQGRAVLGRARADGRLWLKATLLNPHVTPGDLADIPALVRDAHHARATKTPAPRTEDHTTREDSTVKEGRPAR
ncbi:pyridoxal phosphate-dependent decarboxylase family protein [Streptomyces polyrhachis]|uniref:Pyridoxal phosphate-dependent decarboxylase family protein n=1 Tax=Streptomyces polyrhachis TaxID=1282885 RepID=A0ABW2G7D4_9ACTN